MTAGYPVSSRITEMADELGPRNERILDRSEREADSEQCSTSTIEKLKSDEEGRSLPC